MEFKPTWLYVKKCSHCDLHYFGKTTSKDPTLYKGSGKYWKQHLKKHDAHAIHVAARLFKQRDKCVRHALRFSRHYDITASKEWANLCDEDGIHGLSKGFKFSKESLEKLSQAHLGNRHSEETKAKISKNSASRRPEVAAKAAASNRGKKRTEEQKRWLAICNPRTGIPGRPNTLEQKAKISAALKGRVFSKEHRANISASKKGVPLSERQLAVVRALRKPYTCPHCQTSGRGSNMKRYHFDNCKSIVDTN